MEEAGAGGRAGIFEEPALEGALEDVFGEQALEGTFEERALENLKPPQGWTRESRTKEGWTEPAGTMARGEGVVRSPEQHPSLSDSAPCLAVPDLLTAHPQPRCRGRSSTPRSHHPRLAPS